MQAINRKDRYMVTETGMVPFDQVKDKKEDIKNFYCVGSSHKSQIGANFSETEHERFFYVLKSTYRRTNDMEIRRPLTKVSEDETTVNKGAFPMLNKNPNKIFGKKTFKNRG